jgi:DNA-binding LacI/PurR family transcriptional regulator
MKAFSENNNCDLPTAYFAFNDIIALGAIKAMKEYGIAIPEQISIVGFDDMPFCEISSPRLTTLKVHKQYIGKTAIRRLIQKISQNDVLKMKIEVANELVERESIRKIEI